MKVHIESLELRLKTPFRIAHGSSTVRHNALIQVGDFFGEAALPPYCDARLEDVDNYLRSIDFEKVLAAPRFAIPQRIRHLPEGPGTAVAAVDMLLFDAWAKSMELPLYALMGLDPDSIPPSVYTMSIPASLNEHTDTLASLLNVPILKLKLGSGNLDYDEEIVRITRKYFTGRLCVDVNSEWSIPDALQILPRLFKHDIEFVEQPILAEELDDWHILKRMQQGPVPALIADESIKNSEDLLALSGAADGVNLKLSKCGGILKTLDLVSLARSLDMTVMIGCMIESSLATTAAAHIAALADFVDLDGITYLAEDPFQGMTYDKGRIGLSEQPGLGVFDVR